MFLVILLSVGYVCAAPQAAKEEPIPIISQENNIEPDGSYQYR